MILDLAGLEWTLVGWLPYTWTWEKWREGGPRHIGPVKAQVPGSVQRSLLEAGMIKDWNIGLNSRDCEWVEHRHWDYTATIPAGTLPTDERIFLNAEGLDYHGWIFVDNKEVARFSGALLPHKVELTEFARDGKQHQLSIIFDQPPFEFGQLGFTSKTKYFKPRYSYSWDWCPRFVPIGISDRLTIRTGASSAFCIKHITTLLADDNRSGSVGAIIVQDPALVPDKDRVRTLRTSLLDGTEEIAEATIAVADGEDGIDLDCPRLEPWWPNGEGEQKLYRLTFQALTADGRCVWSEERTVGFKRVEWRACVGAPEGADPWLCVVNGKPVFLRGVNWTPPNLSYLDVADSDYRDLLGVYREMGCNIFRVWGGAGLEKEAFYDLCDQAGVLVWQEFPLSSSGLDNLPPEDDGVLADLEKIATMYVRRRSHHASLLLWCGGNELYDGTDLKNAKLCDLSVKAIRVMKNVVDREDPGRRFLATSPTGPRFTAEPQNYGKGLHHDVHGPWGWDPSKLSEWDKYWQDDDSLFRSEVGFPSASGADLIREYSDGLHTQPPNHAYWRHAGHWWEVGVYRKLLKTLSPEDAFLRYIEDTQRNQAHYLGIAFAAMKKRFPRCGGFIIWMGHDCLPCPANCSIVDYRRRPKPVGQVMKKLFGAQIQASP